MIYIFHKKEAKKIHRGLIYIKKVNKLLYVNLDPI